MGVSLPLGVFPGLHNFQGAVTEGKRRQCWIDPLTEKSANLPSVATHIRVEEVWLVGVTE